MTRFKRHRLEIIRDIIKVVIDNDGISSTKLLQKANLSKEMFDRYLKHILTENYLRVETKEEYNMLVVHNYYYITPIGFNKYERLNKLLGE